MKVLDLDTVQVWFVQQEAQHEPERGQEFENFKKKSIKVVERNQGQQLFYRND